MSAPIVTGAAALMLQRLLAAQPGRPLAELRAALRQELLTNAFRHLAAPALEVGIGRLNLGSI